MRTPLATYRLQLRPEFGFDDAAAVAEYLAALGVTHAYASPYLQAASGSTHGYDVVDHGCVNRELGGEDAHVRFCDALGAAGLGQVLDVVPNHMAVTPENAWWTDVLENGPSSRYASYFDVDWDPPERKLRNTVLMPVLGDHYGRVLEAGELRLARAGSSFVVQYYEHNLPVAPRSYDAVLGVAAAISGSDDLAFLAGAFAALPPAWMTDRPSVLARHRDKEVLKRQLARLLAEDPSVVDAVDEAMRRINDDPDLLDALLDRQNFRLALWRTAGQELDYRRFFDINTLAGLRVEDEQVFADTHARVLDWLRQGVLDGLRIDHPDGLLDPAGYVERLRECSPTAWLVLEKILEPGESLPVSWPVDGTTGYDFLNRVGGLLVDPAGEEPLTEAYASFTGESVDYAEVVHRAKHLVLEVVLAADVNRLTNLFVRVCEAERRYRDFTRSELAAVLTETIACFSVYRTYIRPDEPVAPEDEAHLREALAAARDRRGDLDPELFDLLGRILRGELHGPGDELCLRFQQTTGPVMAKGVEDTAFYRFNRLVSLNEVGGDPSRFATDPAHFHAAMADMHERWPATMTSSSTHDTKRSEDVRARLSLLSEIPGEFEGAVRRWSSMNERHRTGDLPDRNLEWLLYQTLVGAHPLPLDRALAYVEKATKEAKVHTSWIDPVEEYDESVRRFVEGALGDDAFTADLDAFVAPLVEPGWVNALSAQLLKLAGPGVPDVYQGTELWDFSLVDPDNRRPVDFGRRRRLLVELDGLDGEAIWARRGEGLAKLHLTHQALHLRRRRPEVFRGGSDGAYAPLRVAGPAAAHAVAFSRGAAVVAVVPRLPLGLAGRGGWGDTIVELPPGSWRSVLDLDRPACSGPTPVGAMLTPFPVALLERTDQEA